MPTALSERAWAQTRARYDGFEKMPLHGKWRHGRADRVSEDIDPYTGDVLIRIPLASDSDLDEAYGPAAAAQPGWYAKRPDERAAVVRHAAEIMEARRDESVDWVEHESGSTRTKAKFEWELAHAVTLEPSTFPSRAAGAIVPTTLPDKESRVDDADLELAVDIGVFGKLLHQGQTTVHWNSVQHAPLHYAF